MRDLEELQNRVLDRRVRGIIGEAVRAYNAGALRSAMVAVWIAVLTDLTIKLRHLADSGDALALEAINKLDHAVESGAVAGVQNFERGILGLAGSKLAMLSDREVLELERLYQDRNRCAHPAFLADDELWVPSSESVRAHLAAAIDATLSQPPLAGKRIVTMLSEELLRDGWPSGGPLLRDYLMDRYFNRARDVVRGNLMKFLVKGSVRPPDGNDRVAQRCTTALAVLADEFPQLHRDTLVVVYENWERAGTLTDRDLAMSLGGFGRTTAFWEAFPRTARARLIGLLSGRSIEELLEDRVFASGPALNVEIATLQQRLADRMTIDQTSAAIASATDHVLFIPAVLKLVAGSKSFRGAESNLRLLQACAASLAADDIHSLQKVIEENTHDQIRRAGDTESILIDIHVMSQSTAEHSAAWRSLAGFLREKAMKEGDEFFNYELLCEAVGLASEEASSRGELNSTGTAARVGDS